jgi:hypothetical protein
MKKQRGERDEAIRAATRLQETLDHAEAQVASASDRIGDTERVVRSFLSSRESLDIESLRRWQLHLAEQRGELTQLASERDAASSRFEEASGWRSRCARKLEVTRRLSQKTRRSLIVEEGRREERALDELWLMGGARTS